MGVSVKGSLETDALAPRRPRRMSRALAPLNDPLFRKTVWLVASTGVMGTCGFAFWLVGAHHYDPATIGVASALISVITFLSTFCLLGLNIAVINHIPKHRNPSSLINSASVIVVGATIASALAFCLFVGRISGHLSILRHNPLLITLFVLFAVVATLDTLLEGVLIAYKDAFAVLVKNTLISILKLTLAITLTAGLDGLFLAYYAAIFISPLLTYPYLAMKFKYKPRASIDRSTYRHVMSSSFGNYIESIGNVLPPAIIAVMLAAIRGPAETAYFYIAMTIATAVYTVPYAVGRNLIVELTGDLENIKQHVMHAGKVLAGLVLPLVLVVVVFGRQILNIFGASYGANAYGLLALLAISAIVLSINCVYWALLNAKGETSKLVGVNLVGMVLTLIFSYSLIGYGLVGIGAAWLVAQLTEVGLYWLTSRTRLSVGYAPRERNR